MAITKEINIVVKDKGLDKANKQIDDLANSLKNADKEAHNLDATFEEIYGDLQPLTSRMGEAEDRLYELGLAGKQTSSEYKSLLASVANYRQVQIKTDLAVDAASSNLSQNLSGALGTVSGGFTVAQGAMASFGVESEETNAAILKVQSAMAISSGFETIKQGTQSFNALKSAVIANNTVVKIAGFVQKVWNLAMSSNPIGALVAVIALAITGITALVIWFKKSSDASDAAMNATKKNTVELKAQSVQAKKTGDAIKTNNDQQYALAKASGASSEALRKLTIKHNEETIALNLKNAKLAQATFLRERDTLATLEASKASDKVIEAQKKLTESTYEEFKEQNKLLSESYKERHEIERRNAVEVLTEKTAASEKASSEAEASRQKEKERIKSEREKEKADAIQAVQDLAKAKADAEMQSAKEALAIIEALKKESETPAEKEQREYDEKKDILEANNVSTAELDLKHKEFIAQQNDEWFAIESDKAIKRDADEKKREDEKKDEKIAREQALQSGLTMLAENTASIFDNLEALGLKKSKAAVAIRKGIALAQIAADTGKAFASAVPMAIDAGKGAASVGGPFAGVLGAIATAASYAGSIAMITSNVARAKQLLSSGGGGSGSTGGGGSMPSAPSFNLVQGTGSNQIASSINTQQPIEAFVVSKNVSTGQELDRNIIKSASL